MKNTAKVLCLLLALCFLFVACDSAPVSQTGGNAATGTQAGTGTATAESTEEGNFQPVKDLSFGGEDFTILVPVSTAGSWAQFHDFSATELTEEPVNDANFERLNQIKNLYDVNIVNVVTPSNSVATDVKNAQNSGDNPYDLVHIELTTVAALAQQGYFVDLNTVNSIDLTNPWYTQNAVKQLSIANRLYYILGDFSTVDNDGIAAVSFNKEMIEEEQLTSPYEYIDNNEWTIDNFYALCKGFSKDLNGDGKLDIVNDRYGYSAAKTSMPGQLTSAGVQIVTKDDKDYPILSLNSTRNASAVEKVLEMYADDTTMCLVENMSGMPNGISRWQYGNNMFMEGRLMFRQTTVSRIIECRQSEIEFGIVPYPKLDSEQENYAHSFSAATPVVCIPATAEDFEANGAVIEALSYYGRTTVRPAYYDRVLQGLVARDEESGEYLDLIFDTADYDLGMVLMSADMFAIYPKMIDNKSNTFASDYSAKEATWNTVLEEYVTSFESNLA
ncbi:MAG: extracellular solute-binding protein [Ruminococcaceae bacterium]|nr:extracellular solute-binding protein [Oscillospiraceae bacterium]